MDEGHIRPLDISEAEADAFDRAINEPDLLAAAKDALWEWAERTHGNEFGHDHHCPVQVNYREVWVDPTTDSDVARCTCGWAAYRRARDQWIEVRLNG